MARRLEWKESTGPRKKKKWWRQRTKELVISKIKGFALK
jgi:hypothetical protein